MIADKSGDVEVISPPPGEEDVVSRPSKRGKGPARYAGEDDVEMIGSKGVELLPHNRFSCPEVGGRHDSRPAAQQVNGDLPR